MGRQTFSAMTYSTICNAVLVYCRWGLNFPSTVTFCIRSLSSLLVRGKASRPYESIIFCLLVRPDKECNGYHVKLGWRLLNRSHQIPVLYELWLFLVWCIVIDSDLILSIYGTSYISFLHTWIFCSVRSSNCLDDNHMKSETTFTDIDISPAGHRVLRSWITWKHSENLINNAILSFYDWYLTAISIHSEEL